MRGEQGLACWIVQAEWLGIAGTRGHPSAYWNCTNLRLFKIAEAGWVARRNTGVTVDGLIRPHPVRGVCVSW